MGRMTCAGGSPARHFLLMAGIGLDAHIVYHVCLPLKARTGKFAYWVAGWSLLGRRLPQIQVDSGGRRFECSFALLSKVRNYAEISKSPRGDALEDRFEMVLFEGSPPRVTSSTGRVGASAAEGHARGGDVADGRRHASCRGDRRFSSRSTANGPAISRPRSPSYRTP